MPSMCFLYSNCSAHARDEVEEIEEKSAEADPKPAVEPQKRTFSPKRGFEGDGGDRYRITIELQQDMFHWCDPSKEPLS